MSDLGICYQYHASSSDTSSSWICDRLTGWSTGKLSMSLAIVLSVVEVEDDTREILTISSEVSCKTI